MERKKETVVFLDIYSEIYYIVNTKKYNQRTNFLYIALCVDDKHGNRMKTLILYTSQIMAVARKLTNAPHNAFSPFRALDRITS